MNGAVVHLATYYPLSRMPDRKWLTYLSHHLLGLAHRLSVEWARAYFKPWHLYSWARSNELAISGYNQLPRNLGTSLWARSDVGLFVTNSEPGSVRDHVYTRGAYTSTLRQVGACVLRVGL